MPAEPGQRWPGSQFPKVNDISKLPAVLGGGDQSHAMSHPSPRRKRQSSRPRWHAVNTINAPDWSSALNTSPLIGLLCQPSQTAALIPILIRHLK